MFHQLFQGPLAIQRQIGGPLLQARQLYLDHCVTQGMSRTTLREIALYQLIVIDYLQLGEEGTVTAGEIAAAAERWARHSAKTRSLKNAVSPLSKARFIKHASRWLNYLGRLHTPPASLHPCTPYVRGFADFMRNERGLSEETISHRCFQVASFLTEVCDQTGALCHLTVSQIEETLLDKVQRASYGRRTIRTLASSLRAFFRYAEQRHWCQRGLADAIRAPRVFRHETLPFSPTWEDVQRLLRTTEGTDPVHLRDRAILLLLATYGLRSGEVRRLQLDDLDWQRELIHLRHVKLGQVQHLPLMRTVGEAILCYLKEVRPRTACRALFLTMRAPWRPLTSGAIYGLVNRRWQPLGIAIAHHGPHALRHACATRLINQGVSLIEIADQLGHRDLGTTRIYAKVDLTRLRAVADFNVGGLLCD